MPNQQCQSNVAYCEREHSAKCLHLICLQRMYTVSQKPSHYNLAHNFTKSWLILKNFLSLRDSLVNLQQNLDKLFHHTLNLLLHYLMKYQVFKKLPCSRPEWSKLSCKTQPLKTVVNKFLTVIIALFSCFTDVSQTIIFPDRRFPDKTFPGQVVSRTSRFPDKTFPGQDVSHTRRFPDNHFPGQTFPRQTFPGQVILRNFHVYSVCKYQLYRLSHTICKYMEHLLMCVCRPAVSIRGLFGKACSPTMGKV